MSAFPGLTKHLKKISIICIDVYVTDFLKTNQTKFAIIEAKRRQKAGFLSPRGFIVLSHYTNGIVGDS